MHIKIKLLQASFLLLCYSPSAGLYAQNKDMPIHPMMMIWDSKPAVDWMTQAYPIGNGRIGGMIFGSVNQERTQFNENTLWTGDESDKGMYQAFGDIFIDFEDDASNTTEALNDVKNHVRRLDLESALHEITYIKKKVSFRRSYFSSFPDKAIVMKFEWDRPGCFTALIQLKDAHGGKTVVRQPMC